MKKLGKRFRMRNMRRLASALLALVLLFGMLPPSLLVSQAHWTDEYINTLVDWGVMRGDVSGNMNGEKSITRAEFVAMVNRAFGYTASTEHPFTDVTIKDWYNNDIGMAYNMGYFKGTGETTASPNSTLTREQAVVLIGRNLLLDEKLGETLGFSDSRTFSEWSRGMVESAISAGFAGGYEDGTFQPQKEITRGEVAAMLAKAIGTMVNKSGTHELGGVYGNVMVSTSGVKLKNTTIAGDLYITGGLELGDVLLENVTVLGKIIVSGAGESHKGDSSIVLRNVDSGELVIDSIADQFVTLRAEGNTQIDFTNVKTSAYLDDQTDVGDGLLYIEMNGESGMNVTLAGNIEEVLNRTPESVLVMAQGTAQMITVDEKAVDSTLDIKNIASIEELNLDIGVPVTGEGDITNIFVNAAGSVVDMLPDDINIRPGLSAEINGEEMDTKEGDESSSEPRILSGYPKIRNLAPNSTEVVYSTNKKGTIHWALTSLIDGPVGEEDLLEVKDYNTKILQQGTINVTEANKDFSVKITKLISDGSYYVSAVLVDSRGQKSPVKYVVFTTPDGTAPGFANSYPQLTQIKSDDAQVAVLPTKDSVLYYAVLPKGAAAPTVSEFKTGAISGDLGNCPKEGIAVIKNVITVRDISEYEKNGKMVGNLEELKSYDLYLCLIDPDNGKDSGVKKLSFTTVDGTPPILEDGMVTGIQKNNVSVTTSMNEVGTIFWVAVEVGVEYLPRGIEPNKIYNDEASAALMKKAVLQVANGMGNVVKAGKQNAKENTDVTMKITGLEPESTYDVYYVAQDKAGNYSQIIRKTTANTLDVVAPTARQEFTKTADASGVNPLPETDIKLIFSEGIRNKDAKEGDGIWELYQAGKTDELVRWLEKSVQLWDMSNISASYQIKNDKAMGAWIDYEKVKMEMVDGELIMTFAHDVAISLGSGSTYQFILEDVTDVSNTQNPMKPNPYKMPQFTTVFAQVNLTSRASSNVSVDGVPALRDHSGAPIMDSVTGDPVPADIDMRFWMDPQSTESVNSNVYYDMWFETEGVIVYLDLYCRVINPGADGDKRVMDADEISMFGDRISDVAGNGMSFDRDGWIYLGEMQIRASGGRSRASVNSLINGNNTSNISQLNSLSDDYVYEFVVDVVELNGSADEASWSENIQLDIRVPAGQDLSPAHHALDKPWINDITNIGVPEDFYVSRKFIDTKTPSFQGGNPYFRPGDGVVAMDVMLDRTGTMYYVIAPMVNKDGYNATVLTTAIDMREGSDTFGQDVDFKVLYSDGVKPPKNGEEHSLDAANAQYKLTAPTKDTVAMMVDRGASSNRIKTGKLDAGTNLQSVLVEGLEPLTTYFVYCILMGESSGYSDVYCFEFTTTDVNTPRIDLNLISGGSVATVWTTEPSDISWAIYDYNTAQKVFGKTNPEVTLEAGTLSALEALTQSDSDTLGEHDIALSRFDGLASVREKQLALEHIEMEATTNNAPVATGSLSISAKNIEDFKNGKFKLPEITTKNMSPDTTYYIVVAAKNSLGQEYVYKAIGGLHLGDTTPPKLRKCTTNTDEYAAERKAMGATYTKDDYKVQLWKIAAEDLDYRAYVYQGTVILDFSEAITRLYTDEAGNRLWEPVDNNFDFDGYVEKTGGVRIENVNVNGSTISFDFHDATIGSSITIFKDGSISDAYSNVSGQGSRIQLTFTVEENEDAFVDIVGNVKLSFVVAELQGDIVS